MPKVFMDTEFEDWFNKSTLSEELRQPCLVAWQSSLRVCWLAVKGDIKDDCNAMRNDIVRRVQPIMVVRSS